MSPHDQSGRKLPDEKICEMVSEAGYDGMAIDLGVSDVKKAFELRPLMERVGLTPLIVAFPMVGSVIRLNTLSKVDFPAPLEPIIPIRSPCLTSKSIFFNAQNSSKL